MRIARIIAVYVVGIVLVLGACAKSMPALTPGPDEVWFQAREFTPSVIIVPVGTTVTWTNKDQRPHTVTSDIGLFSGTIVPSGHFSYTFTSNGTFNYYDDFDEAHREMRGTVYVQ